MKHLKNINEENQISRKELAEQMIRIFEQKYKSHPSSFGSVLFEWEDNLEKQDPVK